MKNCLLLAFWLLFPLLSHSQVHLDSLIHTGITLSPCKSTLYNGSSSIVIPEGELVTVVAARRVIGAYGANHDYFDFYYKSKLYYAGKDKIDVTDELFDQLMSLDDEDKETYRKEGAELAETQKSIDMLEAAEYIEKLKTKGLAILSWSFEESEYIKAIDISFSVINPTKKTIKYIWFNVVGYNPVGDKVVDPFKRTSLITLRAIGPIEHLNSGTYSFESAWNTNLVDKVKIASIKVQYMDGTFKTITNPSSIEIPERYVDIITSN